MDKKEKSIITYPIHDPDDESSGMDLIDKKEQGKKSKVGDAGKYKWVSFSSFMKDQNTFAGTHNFKEELEALEASYKQPSQGSVAQDPKINVDVNMFIEKLTIEQQSLLSAYADKLDSNPEELVRLAINRNMNIHQLLTQIEKTGF